MNTCIAQDTVSFLTTGEALRIARRDREIERHSQRAGNLLQLRPQLRERIIRSLSARDQSIVARDQASHHDTHNHNPHY